MTTFAEVFGNIYDKKERTEKRKRLLNELHFSQGTVRRWINGDSLPPKWTHKKIAEIMGKSIEDLFPAEIRL